MVLAALLLQFQSFVPTSAYDLYTIQGWSVKIEHRLKQENPNLFKETKSLLESQLKWILKNLPPEKIKILRQTKIWIDFDSLGKSAMQYHPSKEWLRENNYNPDKAKSVEVSHPQLFVDWIKTQPCMVLHELAHSYHDRILGFDNKRVKEAFDQAVTSKLYESVLHANGKKQRHYALNNPQEFFAEMTESYFGKNDFYPFNRQELKEYDLKTYLFIEKEWLLR